MSITLMTSIMRRDRTGKIMHLYWHLGCWGLCSNIENKQCNSQTHHKSPAYLQRNPYTRRTPPKRAIPPPPPTFPRIIILPCIIIIIIILFLLIIFITTITKSMPINNDQTVYAVLGPTNLFSIDKRVVWSTRGVTRKSEPWDLRVLVEEYCIGSCWGVECGFKIVGFDIGTVCTGDCGWALNVVCTWVRVKQGFLVFTVHSMNVCGHWEWLCEGDRNRAGCFWQEEGVALEGF